MKEVQVTFENKDDRVRFSYVFYNCHHCKPILYRILIKMSNYLFWYTSFILRVQVDLHLRAVKIKDQEVYQIQTSLSGM